MAFIFSFTISKNAMIVPPIIGSPYGLNRKPIIKPDIPFPTSPKMKEAIAPNIQNSITKNIKNIPILSRKVRNAVNILSTMLIGNNIIFSIHHIVYFSLFLSFIL